MDERLEARVLKSLQGLDLTLVLAESCTGGLIGHRITNVPGASASFLGGYIAYSDDAKKAWLGVAAETLAREGAVSEATALAMARGARAAHGPAGRVGLGITGIAGPGGGSEKKPVGMTCMALSGPYGDRATTFLFLGGREEIKAQAAEQALRYLLNYLEVTGAYTAAEVVHRTDSDGLRWAERFTSEGQMRVVVNNGRRWSDDRGDHLLVQAEGGQVFELLFEPVEKRWWHKRGEAPFGLA